MLGRTGFVAVMVQCPRGLDRMLDGVHDLVHVGHVVIALAITEAAVAAGSVVLMSCVGVTAALVVTAGHVAGVEVLLSQRCGL